MASETNQISDDELTVNFENEEFAFPKKNDYANHLAEQYLFALLSDCHISLDRTYHPCHLWTKIESSDVVQIGIDRLIIKLMEPLSQLVLPEIGRHYQRNQLLGWIVRKEQPYPLHIPIGGVVIAINPALNSKPIDQLGTFDSWLLKIRDKNIQEKLEQQCTTMQSLQNYVRKIGIIRRHLHRSLSAEVPENMEVTLADGGKIESRLEKVIGIDRFKTLTEELFQKKG